VREAKRYLAERPGVVSFTVRQGRHEYGWRGWRSVPAASLMKPMLLVAYLRRPDVRDRPLQRWERRMLRPMIRVSGNDAASRCLGLVGVEGELAVARLARMRDFTPFTVWGLSRTSARDQALFFQRLRRLLPDRHEALAMRWLRTIAGRQRWGVGQVRVPGWRMYFKGGWGSARGLVDHQVARLERGKRIVTVAITTLSNGSHEAGKATLEGVARRLLRGLPLSAAAGTGRRRP
jgi:beta-lactamase class A